MLIGKKITKSYGEVEVLKGVDIQIHQGEMVSIIGPSGAGKSTLLHILSTLDKANSGEIHFNEVNVSNLSAKELAKFRNENIGFIFQFHHLLPEFNALENVCVPAWIANKNKQSTEAIAKKIVG
jgi:lipoprotein-releasing system ATP-binding protein